MDVIKRQQQPNTEMILGRKVESSFIKRKKSVLRLEMRECKVE